MKKMIYILNGCQQYRYMYKLDPNIKDLNKVFEYNAKYKINSIKNLTNHFKKLK